MEIGRLFKVLVVGGTLLAADAGCTGGEGSEDSKKVLDQEQPDSGAEQSDGGANPIFDAGDALTDAAGLENGGFCPNELACEIDEEGDSVLRAGFECCWATSC